MGLAALLVVLAAIYVAAKGLGEAAERLGQPAVLGELAAGVLLGGSALALINPAEHTLHILAELGVLILLFEIGLSSDLQQLLRVGLQSLVVALAGMLFPFLLGWGVMAALGYSSITSIFVGAALTATSIGITARVLADMGKIGSPEAQIILGAAIIDDVLGLVVLALVKGLAEKGSVSAGSVVGMSLLAVGFFAAAVTAGQLLAPQLVKIASLMRVRGVLLVSCISFAFVLSAAADAAGSAAIVGAFAAGLVLARTDRRVHIQESVRPLADFFVPIFFATAGAAVDVRYLDPSDPQRRQGLLLTALLLAAAILGKWLSGFFAYKKGTRLRRSAIGIGMIPRGEVGLVFAGLGLATGVAHADTYAAIVVVVMLSTFAAPPLLRAALG